MSAGSRVVTCQQGRGWSQGKKPQKPQKPQKPGKARKSPKTVRILILHYMVRKLKWFVVVWWNATTQDNKKHDNNNYDNNNYEYGRKHLLDSNGS
jgi:hypothetical protein